MYQLFLCQPFSEDNLVDFSEENTTERPLPFSIKNSIGFGDFHAHVSNVSEFCVPSLKSPGKSPCLVARIWLVVEKPLWKIWESVGMILPYIVYIYIYEICIYIIYIYNIYIYIHKYIYIYTKKTFQTTKQKSTDSTKLRAECGWIHGRPHPALVKCAATAVEILCALKKFTTYRVAGKARRRTARALFRCEKCCGERNVVIVHVFF